MKYWEENKIYERLKEYSRSREKKYIFIDGPPYTSSPVPHIGTVWNKVIKDSVLRFRRILGYEVYDRPGYDTHGLPIEVIMEKNLGIKNKSEIIEKVGVDVFVSKCKEFALANAKGLTEAFKNMGVFMDWENPYMTLEDTYISKAWNIFKKADELGLLEKGVDVLHWCPRCETTLADYEVSEYKDLEDPSIYVKFRVKGSQNRYLLIWTTTPWTIPANVFIMINKDYDYADVEVNGEVLVMALKRVEEIMKQTGVKNYKILRTYKGSELIGVSYEHPLKDIVPLQQEIEKYHIVVDAGENVTLAEGTGLVHSAPGHGDIDYKMGLKIDAPIIMLVDNKGSFTKEAGKYYGKKVRESASEIIDDLNERNALFYSTRIVHRYPVCWRCKTPLILKATDQWFIRVSKLKDKLLKEIDNVLWVPEWGKLRISNLVKEIRDWVVSRQRFWGTPLPIWICQSCGYRIVIGSLDELKKYSINGLPKDLHRPWIDEIKLRCTKCGGVATRVPDVADVWFDSGVAFHASLDEKWAKIYREKGRADFVVEGTDQLRGWFFSLLRSSVILNGNAPYEAVLVHGFMLDEQGREMHKSLGNYVEPNEVMEKYSRDILRLWLLSNTVWEDAKFSWKAMEEARKDLQIIWNTYVFASMYMSLDNFNPKEYPLEKLKPYLRLEDLWILSRFNSVAKNAIDALKVYKVHEYTKSLIDFLINDVSRTYIKLIRKRVWIEENTPDKLTAYATLYYVLKRWIILASVIIPFMAEKIYLSFVLDHLPSVSMEVIDSIDEHYINPKLDEEFKLLQDVVEAGLSARAKAGIKLRWPLKNVYLFINSKDIINKLNKIKPILLEMLNTKNIEINEIGGYRMFEKVRVEPRYSSLGPKYKRDMPFILNYINENQDKIADDILKVGSHKAVINGKEIIFSTQDVEIIEETTQGYVSSRFNLGVIVISKMISEEEEEEGLIRDIIRRIQYMRKQLNINVNDYIVVSIKVPSDRVKLIVKWRDYIANETRARDVKVEESTVSGELVQTWDIEGEEYIIGITKSI